MLPTSAYACGYCIEDRIAAVYDHAAIVRAQAERQQVAFFALGESGEALAVPSERIRATVESLTGVGSGSARVSTDAASLAVAFDPQRTSAARIEAALEEKLSIAVGQLRVVGAR